MKRQEVELEQSLSQREGALSRTISDLLSGNAAKSRLYADAQLATDTLVEAEGSVRLMQFERETMQQDITVRLSYKPVPHKNFLHLTNTFVIVTYVNSET